jgi:error-prone DNA polymerase
MVACRGRVQREGEVIHVIAEHLDDLSGLLRDVGARDERFPLPHGRGDQARHGGPPDPREFPSRIVSSGTEPAAEAPGNETQGILLPELRLDSIKVKSRNFH